MTGTVGQPGHRTFFLQARKGSALVSVVIEKAQVLAERLALLLRALSRHGVEQPDEEAGLMARSGAPDQDETPGPDDDGSSGEEEDPGPESELPPAVDLPPDLALRFLHSGDLAIVGRLVQASNTTLLVRVTGEVPGRGPTTAGAVYKPIRGERPLWEGFRTRTGGCTRTPGRGNARDIRGRPWAGTGKGRRSR